jgi:uncharacterized membrane protein YeiB
VHLGKPLLGLVNRECCDMLHSSLWNRCEPDEHETGRIQSDLLEQNGRPAVRMFFTRYVWLLVFVIMDFLFLLEGNALTAHTVCVFALYFRRHFSKSPQIQWRQSRLVGVGQMALTNDLVKSVLPVKCPRLET